MWWKDAELPEDDKHVRHLPAREMLRRVVPLFRPHLGALCAGLALLLVSVAADLAGPLVLRHLIDVDIADGSRDGIVRSALLYAALFLVATIANYVQVVVLTRMGLAIVTHLKETLFHHLMGLSLAYFDKNPPGKLMARVESDTERLQALFSEVAIAVLRTLTLLLGALTVMFLSSWQVTLGILCFAAPVVVGTVFYFRWMRGLYRRVRAMVARISGFVSEYVLGVPILQVFGYEHEAERRLERLNEDKLRTERVSSFFEYGFWGVLTAIEVVAIILLLFLGSGRLFGVTMTVGTLVLFVEYTRRVFWPLAMFSEQIGFIQRAFASADRVFGVLDTPSRTPDRADAATDIPDDWAEIAFQDVSFVYDGGTRALDHVSFRIRRGEKVALVGLSGGGKSTITSLLLRFYEPTEGAVTLDGVDIRAYRQKAWRSRIGLVQQDIHLFPGTVADNLRALVEEVGQEALERAARTVGADQVIARLPLGYEEPITEGGANLSMGERQLLSFARALVHDPDLLILDEATSSVDPGTERRLQESMDRMLSGRTALVIAHRLATVVTADRILVVHGGRIVEEGAHDELYAQRGVYRDLFDLQFRKAEFGVSAPVTMTTREHLAWLAEYWRPHRVFACVLVFWTLLSSAVAVAFPLVWKLVIEGLEQLPPGQSLADAELSRFAAILAAIAVGRVVVGLYPAFRAWMNLNIEKAVRGRVFASILTKDHSFFGRFRTGDLVTRLTDDITEYPRIAWFGCSGIFRFLDSAARVFFCVGAMLLYCDVRLALLAMIPVPLMLWVFYMARKELTATYGAQQAAVSRTNDTLESALTGVRIVKAFNADAGQERRLAAVLKERIGIQLKLAKLVALVHQSDNVASRLGQVVVLSVGGLMVIDGEITLGTLFALHLYLDMLVHPMMDLPNLLVSARQAFVSIDREEEVLRTPAAARTHAAGQTGDPIERIAMEDASFRYRPDMPAALDGVAFSVERGSSVAVVGAVASGKTTLLRVLAGLVPLDEGRCIFGERDSREWDWSTLRTRVGYVPQESLLFSESIEDNVSFGRDVGPDWVRECLRVAQMGGDLERIEAGAGAKLGRGGTLVSGGQKQRIAIARALAGRPEILLLDDCTSSLDARNEDRLWAGIREHCPGVTIFCVSHRPSTIRRADLILVLDAGRLVDSGTHEALSRRCREYGEFLHAEERRQHLTETGRE